MRKTGYDWRIIKWLNKHYPTWARYENCRRFEWVWYFDDGDILSLELYSHQWFCWNYSPHIPMTNSDYQFGKRFSDVKKYLKAFHNREYVVDYLDHIDEITGCRSKYIGRFGYVTKD